MRHFMEQGALAVHWAQLHDASYLGIDPAVLGADALNSGYGFHGALVAHYLAGGGDTMLPKPVVSNAGALMPLLLTHASRHADGSASVMLTNTSPTVRQRDPTPVAPSVVVAHATFRAARISTRRHHTYNVSSRPHSCRPVPPVGVLINFPPRYSRWGSGARLALGGRLTLKFLFPFLPINDRPVPCGDRVGCAAPSFPRFSPTASAAAPAPARSPAAPPPAACVPNAALPIEKRVTDCWLMTLDEKVAQLQAVNWTTSF